MRLTFSKYVGDKHFLVTSVSCVNPLIFNSKLNASASSSFRARNALD